MPSIFELDFDWILYPFWGPKWIENVTKLIVNLPFSWMGVVNDFLECQVDGHAPFWSGLVSFDPRFSLENTVFLTFPSLAKHRFANKVASIIHLPSDQQNDKKSFKK